MRESRSRAALKWAPLVLLMAVPLSLAGVSVAAAAPTAVSVSCADPDADPSDCTPVEEPPTEPTPTETPVDQPTEQPQPPAEQPPAEQPPAPVEEDPSYYYEDDEPEPEAVVPPAPVATTPTPTPSPTPKATVAPAPTSWNFPLYTGEPEHDANVLALGALALSVIAVIAVGASILIRRVVVANRTRKNAPRVIPQSMTIDEATMNILPSTEPELSDFDLLVMTDRTDATP